MLFDSAQPLASLVAAACCRCAVISVASNRRMCKQKQEEPMVQMSRQWEHLTRLRDARLGQEVKRPRRGEPGLVAMIGYSRHMNTGEIAYFSVRILPAPLGLLN